MFSNRLSIGQLALESAQLNQEVPDVQAEDGRLLTQEELDALIEEERKIFAGSDMTLEALEEAVEKYSVDSEDLLLDIESVFMAWSSIRSARTDRDAAIAAKLASQGFKRLEKLYHLSFEEAAATDTSKDTSDDKADSGFVAGVKKMWQAFIDMLKNIWKKIKELLFGAEAETMNEAAASAKKSADTAAEAATALNEQGVGYIAVKSSIISYVREDAEAADLIKVLDVFRSGSEVAVKVISSYKTLATKIKNELKPDMKDVDPVAVKENLLKAMMAEIKSSMRDTPSSALSEAIKLKTGMDTTTTGSEKWAMANMGFNELCILIYVDQLGNVPLAYYFGTDPKPDAVININVTDLESVRKTIADVFATAVTNFETVRKDLAEITQIEKDAAEQFEKLGTANAKGGKVAMDALFSVMKGTPKTAGAVASAILKNEGILKDLGISIDKAIEVAKKEAAKKAKQEAKENKDDTESSGDEDKPKGKKKGKK